MKACFVCLGNICRSPMAEFVLKEMTANQDWQVASRATSSWEVGNPIFPGTQEVLRRHAISYDQTKRAQQISQKDLADFDVILAMDEQNLKDLKTLSQGRYDDKIRLFIEGGVPDPYYTGDFEETYTLVLAGCKQLIESVGEEMIWKQ